MLIFCIKLIYKNYLQERYHDTQTNGLLFFFARFIWVISQCYCVVCIAVQLTLYLSMYRSLAYCPAGLSLLRKVLRGGSKVEGITV